MSTNRLPIKAILISGTNYGNDLMMFGIDNMYIADTYSVNKITR